MAVTKRDERTARALPGSGGVTGAGAKAGAPVRPRPAFGRIVGPLLLAAFALALPAILGALGAAVSFVLYLVSLALIYGIVAIGLNLLVGNTGQFSIGHAGFLAIGAYTSAVLMQRAGWQFVLALPAAGLLTAAVGFLLGLPALRLSGPYLAVATLGFGVAVPQLVVWRGELTGGTAGLQGLPPAALPIWYDGTTRYDFQFTSGTSYYYLTLAVTALMALLAANVLNSHTGRAFGAIRDSELAAQAMGVNLLRYKTTAFALSAFFAGIAGSLYAHLVRGIAPESFNLFLSVEFLTMIVVGGLGSIRGALLGALFLTALPEIFSRAPILREPANKNLYVVAFGVMLILAVIFLPHGLAGALQGRGLRLPGRDRTPAKGLPNAGAPAVAPEDGVDGSVPLTGVDSTVKRDAGVTDGRGRGA